MRNVPASSGFCSSAAGRWALKGTTCSSTGGGCQARSEQAQPLVELLDVERARRSARSALRRTVKFRVLGDDLVGSYEIGLTAGIDPDRSDTLYYNDQWAQAADQARTGVLRCADDDGGAAPFTRGVPR